MTSFPLTELWDALRVSAGVFGIHVVLPALLARTAARGRRLSAAVRAIGTAFGLQAALGLVAGCAGWPDPPWAGALGLLGLCALWPWLRPADDAASAGPAARPTGAGWLAACLVLAWIVRTLAPLDTMALGQSDAYGHVQFLDDVLHSGRVRHGFYPAGYHWTLALPAALAHVDAYTMIRFAGAPFGVLLVFVAWAVLRDFDRRAALLAAAVLAAFPGLMLLHKTSVGGAPIQLGLLLTPALLAAWDALGRGQRRALAWLLPVAVGLAVTSPFLLFDLCVVLGLDVLLRLARRETRGGGRRWLLLIPAAAIPVALLLARGDAAQLAATVQIVTGAAAPPDSVARALGALVADYVRVKHAGLGQPLLTGGVAILLAVCGAGLAVFRRGPALVRLLALAGAVAGVQTLLGVAQFSLYQRAGWTLLLCAALTGAALAGFVWDRVPTPVRRLALVLLAGSMFVSVAHPPRHAPHLSPAENALVATLRHAAGATPSDTAAPGARAALRAASAAGQPVTVVVRPFTGFAGFQGDPVHALLAGAPGLAVHTLSAPDAAGFAFDRPPYLVLLDDGLSAGAASETMRGINRPMADEFLAQRTGLMSANAALRARLAVLEAAGTHCAWFDLAPGLSGCVLTAPGRRP